LRQAGETTIATGYATGKAKAHAFSHAIISAPENPSVPPRLTTVTAKLTAPDINAATMAKKIRLK